MIVNVIILRYCLVSCNRVQQQVAFMVNTIPIRQNASGFPLLANNDCAWWDTRRLKWVIGFLSHNTDRECQTRCWDLRNDRTLQMTFDAPTKRSNAFRLTLFMYVTSDTQTIQFSYWLKWHSSLSPNVNFHHLSDITPFQLVRLQDSRYVN